MDYEADISLYKRNRQIPICKGEVIPKNGSLVKELEKISLHKRE